MNALLPPQTRRVSEQLARSETIENAYELWAELKVEHASFEEAIAEQRKLIEGQGEFLVGTVKAAHAGSSEEGLATADAFLGDARAKLERARGELDAAATAGRAQWVVLFRDIVAEVARRVDASLVHAKPALTLLVRTLAGDRRILHLQRVSPDDSVRLLRLLTGKLPTRYGFLFDDSTDDQNQPLPTLYAEDAAPDQRPDAVVMQALMRREGETLPVKAVLPLQVGEKLVRFVARGPVLEAELADGLAFRNVLSSQEAETIAGALLRLKLQNKLQLELTLG